VEGAANEKARGFLSELLNRPVSSIRLWKGAHSREKIFKVEGLTAAQVLETLEKESE
jgi:uncharacterized protein YggU (UPF0235/DUF167 family)